MSSQPSNPVIYMGRSHPRLGNGLRHDPFSHMKNTSFLASFVVPVEIGAAVVTVAVPRNTFEASFPILLVRPVLEGLVCTFRFPTTRVGLIYPSVMFLALSPEQELRESVPPVTPPFGQPNCLFTVTTHTGSVSYSDSFTT